MRFSLRKRRSGGWYVMERATGRHYARANSLPVAVSLMRRHDRHFIRSIVRGVVAVLIAAILFGAVPFLIGFIEANL